MTIKKFRVEDQQDNHALVEIDTDVINADTAKEINTFWGNWEHRLERAGSHEMAVVTMFGRNFIQEAMADGGTYFGDTSPGDVVVSEYWNAKLTSQEGWPAKGIRIYDGLVEVPGFDDMRISEEAS